MERFYVKRPTGKVFGPFDANAIRMMVTAQKIGPDAQVSVDKENWMDLGQVAAFADLVGAAPAVPPRPQQLPTMAGGWGVDPDLPASRAAVPAPRPAVDPMADLPQRRQASAASNNDLFGGPSSGGLNDLFGAPASPASNDLFASPAPSRNDDLFGAPAQPASNLFAPAGSTNDLFGSPAASHAQGLFGAPVAAPPAPRASAPSSFPDDLFGAPPAAPAAAQHFGRDPFGAPPSNQAPAPQASPFGSPGDDFLGGDSGFSFLDPTPQAAPQHSAQPKAWNPEATAMVDPMANRPSYDPWGQHAAPPQAPQAFAPSFASQADPFGTQPGFGGPTAPAQAPATPAKGGGKGKIVKIIGAGVAVAALAGGGAFAYLEFSKPAQTVQAPAQAPVQQTQVDLAGIQADNHPQLLAAIEAGRQANLSPEESGKLLVIQSLFLARYQDDGIAQDAETRSQALANEVGSYASLGMGAHFARQGNGDAARPILENLVSQGGDVAYFAQLFLGIADVVALVNMPKDEPAPAADPAPEGQPAEGATAQAAPAAPVDAPAQAAAQAPAQAPQAPAPVAAAQAPAGQPAAPTAPEAPAAPGAPAAPTPPEAPAAPAAPAANPEAQAVAQAPAPGAEAQPAAEAPAQAEAQAPPSPRETVTQRARATLQTAAILEPTTAQPHYWLGRLESLTGRTEEAVKAYAKAIELNPSHVAARLEGAARYYERGELNATTQHIEAVLTELAPGASAKETAQAHFSIGRVQSARRQSTEAIASFKQALTLDPTHPRVVRMLGEEFERAGLHQEALDFFTADPNLNQESADVVLARVRAHIGMQQWDEVLALLETGGKQFTGDVRFTYALGLLNIGRGSFVEARTAFQKSVEEDPSLLLAQAHLAQLTWMLDNDAAAAERHVALIVAQPQGIDAAVSMKIGEFYASSGRPPIARQWFEDAIQRDPNLWTARMALSKLLLETGQNDLALQLLERARQEGIQDIRLSAYLADAYRQSGKFDAAVDQINKVIEQQPSNEEYLFIRGRIAFDRRDFENAREDFNKAYELNPRYYDAYFFVGRTALETSDFTTAKRIFRHVLDYQPANGEYYFYMGRTFEAENNVTQALEQYRRATVMDPEYGTKNPAIFMRRGALLARIGQTREGKADIGRALQAAPDMVEARIAMGEAEYRDKQYKLAIEHYTKALAQKPEVPDAQYFLGMAYIYEGNRPSGVQHLEKALEHGYKDPEIHRTMGYAYKELSQGPKALESFKTYLRETADRSLSAAQRREILRQIQELGG